jgi:hypothetical protein
MATESGDEWLFQRAVRQADIVEGLVADYAASDLGRRCRGVRCGWAPAEGLLGKVTWWIDNDVDVELAAVVSGPHEVAVYDVGLLRPLRQPLRTRHFLVAHRSHSPL